MVGLHLFFLCKPVCERLPDFFWPTGVHLSMMYSNALHFRWAGCLILSALAGTSSDHDAPPRASAMESASSSGVPGIHSGCIHYAWQAGDYTTLLIYGLGLALLLALRLPGRSSPSLNARVAASPRP